MIIKEIKSEEDFKKTAALAELCFHDETATNLEKFYKYLKDFYNLGAFEEDNLLAAAGFHDFDIYIRNQLVKCSGIAGVMTHPIHRRKGYVKKLMIELLKKSYEDGYETSALWPFSHSFYRKFGYESADRLVDYKIKPSNIKEIKANDDIVIRECKGEEDYSTLNKIANKALNKYTRIIGNNDAWLLRGPKRLKIFIFEKKDQPIGYVSLKFEKAKGTEWGTYIRVVDWAYDSISTKKTILSFLKNFESDIREIKIGLPYEEEMLVYLKDFNTQHTIANWPVMIRIINIKKLIEGIQFPQDLDVLLYAKIKDEHLSENEGIWSFKIKNGRSTADKIESKKIDQNRILNLSINQLSQIIVGAIDVKSLTESFDTDVPIEWLNEQLFPTKPCKVGVWF
jgi:predicted acetyltransferase